MKQVIDAFNAKKVTVYPATEGTEFIRIDDKEVYKGGKQFNVQKWTDVQRKVVIHMIEMCFEHNISIEVN